MKKNRILLLLLCVMMLIAAGDALVKAQVKIGGELETDVTPGAVLDLSQGTGGLLLPQVTDTIAATRTAGMMVFSLADNKVYTYNGITATWAAF